MKNLDDYFLNKSANIAGAATGAPKKEEAPAAAGKPEESGGTLDPALWDQVSDYIKANPGQSIGGLGGLALGGALGSGGGLGGSIGGGLLGAGLGIGGGLLLDHYRKTNRLPWQDYSESAPQTIDEAFNVINAGGTPEAGELGAS